MTPSLLHPPGQLSPADALSLSQQAPALLQTSISSSSETAELWLKYENLLQSCLRTGDESAARQCLERLVARFGEDNERVMALKGLVKEADARNDADLDRILNEYDQILKDNDTNIPIHKRRITLLRSLGRVAEAASALIQLLDFTPTDAEAWSELSDVYLSQGMYPQAIYALEEVLVMAPNAWNIHARLGELQYMAAISPGSLGGGSSQKYLAESLKRFSRSIELCDDYLRGYYGLKLVTGAILKDSAKPAKQVEDGEFSLPDTKTVERLNELATSKLSEIGRHATGRERGWRGYDELEVAAARELLSAETSAHGAVER